MRRPPSPPKSPVPSPRPAPEGTERYIVITEFGFLSPKGKAKGEEKQRKGEGNKKEDKKEGDNKKEENAIMKGKGIAPCRM